MKTNTSFASLFSLSSNSSSTYTRLQDDPRPAKGTLKQWIAAISPRHLVKTWGEEKADEGLTSWREYVQESEHCSRTHKTNTLCKSCGQKPPPRKLKKAKPVS